MKPLAILLCLFLTSCASVQDKWTTTNQLLFGTVVVTQVLDGLQYERDKDNPHIKESNPNVTDDNIWAFKLGIIALTGVIGHYLSAEYRNWAFGGLTAAGTVVIINNQRVKSWADNQ